MAENTATEAPENTAAEAPKKNEVRMPHIRGASTKGITTVVTIYDNATVEARPRKDGSGMTSPGAFVNAEMARFEGANPDHSPQWRPDFRSEKVTNEAGETRYNTGVFYTQNEINSFMEAGKGNAETLYRHVNGEPTDEKIGVTMVIDVDTIIDKERGGLRMNHKTATETKAAIPEEGIQNAQFQGRARDREVLTAKAKENTKKTEASASKAEPEAQAVADEPEFG